MIMRCTRAYCSSCSQVVLVYVIYFVTVHTSAGENRKKSLKPHCWGSMSFKVIDVDTTKNHFTSDCYVKQHVCAYLQAFSC